MAVRGLQNWLVTKLGTQLGKYDKKGNANLYRLYRESSPRRPWTSLGAFLTSLDRDEKMPLILASWVWWTGSFLHGVLRLGAFKLKRRKRYGKQAQNMQCGNILEEVPEKDIWDSWRIAYIAPLA
ncbi:hypothetical protein F5888DRAFT_1637414 [Russula emetica]|nr:hypothetical protein F5888DRAFT_1637414 [Russula emetica]